MIGVVLGLAACSGDDARSSVNVVVSEGDPALATRLERLDLIVERLDDRGVGEVHLHRSHVPSFAPDGRLRPWAEVVRPAREGDTRLYRYRAVGIVAGTEVVFRQARLPFLRGARLVLPLQLDGSCVGRSCAPAETCAAGACRDDYVPPCSLLTESGSPECDDAGTSMDARTSDARTNDASPLDSPVLDASPSIDARGDTSSLDARADVPVLDAETMLDVGSADASPPVGCTTEADCPSDGLSCTSGPICSDGTCIHTLMPGTCLIDGACRGNAERNPSNDCEECAPSTSPTGWSPRTGSCDDGLYCTVSDACAAGVCRGSRRGCGDALSCTTDSCNEDDDRCDNTILPGRCLIGALCYSEGAVQMGNDCHQCISSVSATDWTVPPGRCLVGTTCVTDGTRGGTCTECRSTVSQTSWSPVDDDTPCSTNGRGSCCAGTCFEGDDDHCGSCATACVSPRYCDCVILSCFCRMD